MSTESRVGGSGACKMPKARFSELVRLAQEAGPAAGHRARKGRRVVVASNEFDHLSHPGTGIALVRAMADRRVQELDFEHAKLRLPVRDVKL